MPSRRSPFFPAFQSEQVPILLHCSTLAPSYLRTINSGNRLANLTMYDVKSLYTQAKNYALNVSEMEAKVREATNDDPWYAT